MILKILGALFVVAGIGSGFTAYVEAGGMHGWNEFTSRFPDALFRGDALTAVLATGAFLIVGFAIFQIGKRRRLANKASGDQRSRSVGSVSIATSAKFQGQSFRALYRGN